MKHKWDDAAKAAESEAKLAISEDNLDDLRFASSGSEKEKEDKRKELLMKVMKEDAALQTLSTR